MPFSNLVNYFRIFINGLGKFHSISLFFSSVLIAIGSVVIIGWTFHIPILIQISPSWVPMQFNTALGFIFCGSALFLCHYLPQKSFYLGSIPLLLGGLTLIQYIGNVDLSIDNFFITHDITTQTSHPGRMAPNTALCFFLCGSFFIIQIPKILFRFTFFLTLFPSIITGLGLISFWGYIMSVEHTYGWGKLTPMAVHTSIGFICFGVSSFFLLWSKTNLWKLAYPQLYWAGGVFSLTICLVIWQALKNQEDKEKIDAVKLKTHSTVATMEELMRADIHAIERMASRGIRTTENPSKMPEKEWEKDAINYVNHIPGMIGIGWLGSNDEIIHWHGKKRLLDSEMALKIKNQNKTMLHLLPLSSQQKAQFLIHTPSLGKDHIVQERLIAYYDLDKFFETLKSKQELNDFKIILRENEKILYQNEIQTPFHIPFQKSKPVFLLNKTWELCLIPSVTFYQNRNSNVISYLLLFGFLISLAVTIIIRLIQGTFLKNAQIREKQEKLTVANEELTQFAYRTSHDICAPLRTIKGFALMAQDELDEKKFQNVNKRLNKIINQADNLSILVRDMLNLCRVEHIDKEMERIDLNELVSSIKEDLAALLEENKVKVETRVSPDLQFYSQPIRIKQILENLISNGIKYYDPSKEKRYVFVLATSIEDNRILIEVKDNGIGIPAEHLDKVFDMFFRVNNRNSFGSGLGTYLVNKHVISLNGKISVNSSAKGTRFSIILPNIEKIRLSDSNLELLKPAYV